ncbi:MAG TPA: S8 family serine peptidase, partial [Rhodanobacteraceae bacterium]
MGTSFRTKTLASAIGLALIGVSLPPALQAASVPNAQSAAQAQANTTETYIIRFVEPGLLHYNGGTQGITATAPKALGQRKLNVHTPAADAYKSYLASQRAAHVAAISQAIGRTLNVTYTYQITMNGVATDLTAAEAANIASMPGVAGIRRAPPVPLATYHGPEFIGADHIWDGSDVPGLLPNRGQGVVVADIDTGINSTHPSFADDPTCGVFGPTNHKLLSAVDCLTLSGGQCVGLDPEANDMNGHGVHTASTAVGNTLDSTAVPPPSIPPPYTFMSGVAPCASLRTYKVCATNNCDGAAIQAATEAAIADQVDVITFSISGGTDPWNDSDRTFLDAVGADIFVAAAAGNTGASVTDPVGAVNHLGPWVASVAATTHDLNPANAGVLSATGPGSPPPNTQNISLNPSIPFNTSPPYTDMPIRHYATNEIGCTANGAFPPDYFDGAIALISRGTCTFEEKIDNAQASGAVAVVIYNNAAGVINMLIGAAGLPAYSILQTDGQNLVAFIDTSDPTPTTVDMTPSVVQGDVLAGFSLRGPSPAPFD